MDGTINSLQVNLDTSTRQLKAQFTPGAEVSPPDAGAIKAALVDAGLAACAIDEAAVSSFVSQCAKAEATVELVIGQQRDGTFDISVSPSRLCAWLTIKPPQGGAPVSIDQIRAAISARNITHNLHEAELAAAVEAQQCNDLVIAEGEEPESGIPARFESLLASLRGAAETEDDEAIVDYRELGSLIVVDPGTPLMRRTPAVQGKDGVDVFDQPIRAQPIPDEPFDKGVKGAAPAEDDANLLVATMAGAPSISDKGISVNPLVDVQDIDLSSGNINFDGTVHVNGDIRAGMSVRVAGDVIVEGTVEAAEVVAGGNIVVKGGIIGKAEVGGNAAETARIQCNGTVQAKFMEHAVVEAGKAITAESGIRQCELTAGESIMVGKPGSNQGSLIGGRARAHLWIRSPVIGSPSGAPTVVQVGVNPFLAAERVGLENERKRKQEDQAKLKQLLHFFEQNPAKAVGGMREKATHTLETNQLEVADLDARIHALAEQMEVSDTAIIEAPRAIHGGVNLLVGTKMLQVVEDRSGAKVRLVDGQIVLG
ncbi:DUF342 domain-containing protein [Chitinimonas sp. BJYL2]|uniref:DUF342 domain-containing protein n=1 Tax=Chitinimonas sp. BJYL2 TaxID=2976696 RepID=UPI0022B37D7C|nr:FapA family protein [Chitinimonas sp. BJYL2]